MKSSRKQDLKNIQTFYDGFQTNLINYHSIRKQKQKKYESQQKSIDIDPWHIYSDKKLNPTSTIKNIYDQQTKNKKYFQLQKRYTKNSSFELLNQTAHQNPFTSTIVDSGILSPTKIDMLECSLRFEAYEQQKAIQIQQKIIEEIKIQDNIQEKKQKNFIQKNIRNAFSFQNQIQCQKINPKNQKSKTICQETKQRLVIKNEKLQKSSKQLHRFISMKDSIPNEKPFLQKFQKCVYKVPIQSKWNFSYLEKEPNPQKKHSKNKKFSILFLKNRGKSQQVKKRQQNIIPTSPNKQNKTQNQLSRKLSRIYKMKNREVLIIEKEQTKRSNKFNFQSLIKQNYRIHSLSPSRKNEKQQQKQFFVQFNKTLQHGFMENSQKHKTKIKNRQHQRSFSANPIKKMTINRNQSNSVQKSTKISERNKLANQVKNLFIKGNQCQLAYNFI